MCQKCGKEAIVQDHHWKGYINGHEDDVAPYCQSCDVKAHINARKIGKCKLPSSITTKLTRNSCTRRNAMHKAFQIHLDTYFRVIIHITARLSGTVNIHSYFRGDRYVDLKYFDIAPSNNYTDEEKTLHKKQLKKIRDRNYYLSHKEQSIFKTKQYYLNNKEEQDKKNLERRLKHKEEKRLYDIAYRKRKKYE